MKITIYPNNKVRIKFINYSYPVKYVLNTEY